MMYLLMQLQGLSQNKMLERNACVIFLKVHTMRA